MNSRQAAKAAAMRIIEQDRILGLNKADIIDYNRCILHMIDGNSPCVFCEDYEECQLEAKEDKGCDQWMLRSNEKRMKQAAAQAEAEKAGDSDDQGQEKGPDIDFVQCLEEQ